jgi:hypothetical protein
MFYIDSIPLKLSRVAESLTQPVCRNILVFSKYKTEGGEDIGTGIIS